MTVEKSLAGYSPDGNILRMKHRLTILLTTLLWVQGVLAVDPPASNVTLNTISWLSGAWVAEGNGRQISEQWMSPAGGKLLGMSRTVSHGRTVEYEFLLLRVEGNGDINYVAKPSGQAETAFKLVRASANEVVFENPQHDFPQRIIYTLKEGDKLTAAVEGTKNGKSRRIEFGYQQVKP